MMIGELSCAIAAQLPHNKFGNAKLSLRTSAIGGSSFYILTFQIDLLSINDYGDVLSYLIFLAMQLSMQVFGFSNWNELVLVYVCC